MYNNFKFSVLMSVYVKENPKYLEESINSVIKQSIVPNEIVIVKDGPLNDELDNILESFLLKYPNIIRIISLDKNKGLGNALKIGLRNCKYDYVARMDSDDKSEYDRFEQQIKCFKRDLNLDVVGSYVKELFPNGECKLKKVPLNNQEIYKNIKFRCPFNHPTVMFKKQSVLDAGGYIDWLYDEDFYLWGRMASKNCKFLNIEKSLVNMRINDDTYSRRGGKEYFYSEAKLQFKFWELKIINLPIMIFNIIIRYLIQFVFTNKLRMILYKKFLRKNSTV